MVEDRQRAPVEQQGGSLSSYSYNPGGEEEPAGVGRGKCLALPEAVDDQQQHHEAGNDDCPSESLSTQQSDALPQVEVTDPQLNTLRKGELDRVALPELLEGR